MSKPENYAGWWNREIMLYCGDELIDQGTIKEIAERRNVRKDTIYLYTLPTAPRRAAKRKNKTTKGLVAIVIEGDDESDD